MPPRKVDTSSVQIEMVPIGKLEPAAYNPRHTDPQRLVHLRTSLTKIGFVLPLYATPEGHLLSGHQRLIVATELGCKKVPVVRVQVPDDRVKKVNLLFNRATNDMARTDTSENLLERLSLYDIGRVTTAVSDKSPNSDEFYRCLQASPRPITELLKGLDDSPFEPSSVTMCGRLMTTGKAGIIMPVVVSQSGKVVNGRYRLLAAAENASRYGITHWPTVVIPDEDAELATLLMNMVSMSFTVEKQYADTLRYGGFRRPSLVVEELGSILRFFADKRRFRTPEQAFADPQAFWRRWREGHGKDVLDLGAGQRRNEPVLAAKGVTCRSWEPYPCPWEHPMSYGPKEVEQPGVKLATHLPNLTLARLLTRDLLADVAAGRKWDSVFANWVVNSIPFHEDRIAFIAVAHACTAFGSAFYGSARGVAQKKRTEKFKYDESTSRMGTFELPYEQDILIGDITKMPKVQKFHSEQSLRPMLEPFFAKVEIDYSGTAYGFKCSAPKRVNPSMLAWAIRKQFDLPYPEEKSSIGMAEEALDAFSKRHRIDLRAAPEFKGAPLEAAS